MIEMPRLISFTRGNILDREHIMDSPSIFYIDLRVVRHPLRHCLTRNNGVAKYDIKFQYNYGIK